MPLMTPDSLIPDQLGAIALAFPEGASSEPVSVRTLLGWFGYERRGRYVVGIIRGALDTVNLITEPDFDSVWLDAQIRFTRPAPRPVEQLQPDVPQQAEQPMEAPFVGGAVPDPTHRVGKLEAANRGVTSVTPDDTIERAITLMMANNFSQLPVMVGERDVKGTVSWESIARRMVVNGLREHVRDCMEPHREIASDASLFAAIPEIVQYQYVLVRDSQKKISGIITGSDLSLQFQQLAEPFLLLGEIEHQIRKLIEYRFTHAELTAAKDPADTERTVQSVADLSLGECVRLLENNDRWQKLALKIDRVEFTKEVHRVRDIRNDVMHFDPDPMGADELLRLRRFARFVSDLTQLMSRAAPTNGSAAAVP